MSQEPIRASPEQLPHLPETTVIEPVVQCGILYLGTAVPSPGRRGIDSIQEPFSHRYPVDGTNTARGIDSVLSIYENGIQLTFARQPHTVIFFPISALIYCASLRFSVVEDDQTSSIDWRFVTLDATLNYPSRHPPLFALVVHRTQILTGDECHCFITKNDDAALTLVRTISEVYASLPPLTKPLRSPIFYQLDRYGRKISETTGVIYLSPASEDEAQLNQITDRSSSIPAINRNSLLDPSLDGFFYRTDGNLIEQWQLWDDDDVAGTRPRPPPSPFGQHQALYHDDLTQEIHHYLRHMDDEEDSTSCSCSSSSSESERHRRHRQKSKYDSNAEQYNPTLSHSQNSSFDPTLQTHLEIRAAQPAPIIIEKVVPNTMVTMPPPSQPAYTIQRPLPHQAILHPPLPPIEESPVSYVPYSETYQINERGEKITTEGNRILYMDVIQPNTPCGNPEPIPYTAQPSGARPRRRRRPKPVPVIDLQSVENIFHEKKHRQRRASHRSDRSSTQEGQLSTTDMLDIVEGYFEDYKGRKIKLNGRDAKEMLQRFDLSATNERRASQSSSQQTYRRRRENHSTINAGPSVSYGERPMIRTPSQHEPSPQPPSFKNEQVNEYVSSIYGSSEKAAPSIKSSSSHQQEANPSTNPQPTAEEQPFISPFRYMQSSINPLLLREYRHAFGGV